MSDGSGNGSGSGSVSGQVEDALLQNALKGSATAQMFWLKNRRPDKWGDKRDKGKRADPLKQVADIARANRAAADEIGKEGD